MSEHTDWQKIIYDLRMENERLKAKRAEARELLWRWVNAHKIQCDEERQARWPLHGKTGAFLERTKT